LLLLLTLSTLIFGSDFTSIKVFGSLLVIAGVISLIL